VINNCINLIQSSLFPSACLLCGQLTHRHTAICAPCENDLPHNQNCCSCCAIPLPSVEQEICAQCQKQPPAFDRSYIPLRYTSPVSDFVQQFKFNNNLVTGKLLADLFSGSVLHASLSLPEALIPVPLYPARTRQRGFNQALWLARKIGRKLNIGIDHNLVKRVRNTAPQHELKHKERLANLNNAFACSSLAEYQSVAIIDDVVTTGTTVNSIASLLKKHGIKEVHVWAIARTVTGKKRLNRTNRLNGRS